MYSKLLQDGNGFTNKSVILFIVCHLNQGNLFVVSTF